MGAFWFYGMAMEKFVYDPPMDPLAVVYQDDDLLIIDKPSGLLSVPGKAEEHKDCLEFRVRAQYPQALLVHRLDMDTSGIMVFALNKPAQRHLGMQFEKRGMKKVYVARVDGVIDVDEGVIELPLILDWPNRPLQIVDHERGKPAKTGWRVLLRETHATRVALAPETGRTHQLRVHMKAIGHTILGDRFYGNDAQIAAEARLQLHAQKLSLRHPDGGAWHEFECDVPF
jgi:tRNA pseudouridine32 synthase/23S rRNA pseudouridine746 synthase